MLLVNILTNGPMAKDMDDKVPASIAKFLGVTVSCCNVSRICRPNEKVRFHVSIIVLNHFPTCFGMKSLFFCLIVKPVLNHHIILAV